MYHIKGELNVSEIIKNDFLLFFKSSNEEIEEKCNKNDNTKGDLCYGSVFKCLKKDKKRFILIQKSKIMFVIKRVYFYRPSGFEIFTSDNKSYYFNFWEKYEPKDENIIIKMFMKNDDFSQIKYKKNIGWYNKSFFDILFPLFNDDISDWNYKNHFYSNFDKFMIINLFSYRSFIDLY